MTKLLKPPPRGPGHLFLSPVPSPQVGCGPDATRAPRWPPLRVSAQRESPPGRAEAAFLPRGAKAQLAVGPGTLISVRGSGWGPRIRKSRRQGRRREGREARGAAKGGLLAHPESRKRLCSHRTKLLLLSLGRRQGSGRGEPTGLNTAAGGFIPWLGRRRGSKREGSLRFPPPSLPPPALPGPCPPLRHGLPPVETPDPARTGCSVNVGGQKRGPRAQAAGRDPVGTARGAGPRGDAARVLQVEPRTSVCVPPPPLPSRFLHLSGWFVPGTGFGALPDNRGSKPSLFHVAGPRGREHAGLRLLRFRN